MYAYNIYNTRIHRYPYAHAHTCRILGLRQASLSDLDQVFSSHQDSVFSSVKAVCMGEIEITDLKGLSWLRSPFSYLPCTHPQSGPLEGQGFSTVFSPEQDLPGLPTEKGKPKQTR